MMNVASVETLLRNTGFFNSFQRSEFESIVKNSKRVNLPAGSIIAIEGDVGDECYLVLIGSVQALTVMPDGQELVLEKINEGHIIGEQALIPGGIGRRNATIRAYSDVFLLVISKENFQQALADDHPLKEKLLKKGGAQIHNKLRQQSILFRSLSLISNQDEYPKKEIFSDGAVFFKEGDEGDKVYLIIYGKVDIFNEHGHGHKKLVAQIGTGSMFGEIAVLENKRRTATAIAHGVVEIFTFEASLFLNLYKQLPLLRDYTQALQKIYPLAKLGFATQHIGRLEDKDCLTTICTLSDARSVISSRMIDHDIFQVTEVRENADKNVETLKYQEDATGIKRELIISGSLIVGASSYGHWTEIGHVYHKILERKPLGTEQKNLFLAEGLLNRENIISDYYNDNQIICQCLQIEYRTLCAAIRCGTENVEQLMQMTNAGSVCGSCIFMLKAIIGEMTEWISVKIIKIIEVTDYVRSFRLEPLDGSDLSPAKAGQNIQVQGRIADRWVQRTYTLTSASQEKKYREITVKREPNGLFSNWLFKQHENATILRISEPSGTFTIDSPAKKQIVCLVSGIGVTPALSFCRTLLNDGDGQPLYIDYSASNPSEFVYQDELLTATKQSNIHVNLRTTQSTGRINKADLEKIQKDFINADFYICGPTGYETAITRILKSQGVPQQRIKIDKFTPSGGQPIPYKQDYFYLGLVLLMVFIAQDSFHLKWLWLENLQAVENYKIGSGIFLSLYIGSQFVLPWKRHQGDFRASTRHYRLHKLQGSCAPLMFYIHSTQLTGYAYLALLSGVYFVNFIVGIFNPERIQQPSFKKTFSFYWLIAHIVFSLVLLCLIVFHSYVALAY